ncbi:14306_t:CDS:1, partial [Acaulospora morrowiae]
LINLDLQGTYISSESLDVIFKWSNINLRSLHVESTGGRFRIPKILESIASHCLNITYLKVRTKKDKLSQLATLLRSCRNLHSLKIYGSPPERLFFFVQDTDDELLLSLRQTIPINLKTLVLKTDCAFTSLAIDAFLKDCGTELKQFEYVSYGSVWQHLNVMKKYAKRRGLEIEKQIAGNYKELLMRELGYIIMEFGKIS